MTNNLIKIIKKEINRLNGIRRAFEKDVNNSDHPFNHLEIFENELKVINNELKYLKNVYNYAQVTLEKIQPNFNQHNHK